MLKCLDIENFRCFERHHVPLQPFTMIVGVNNAGKSTIAEALRLISVVVSRYEDLSFGSAPSWTGLGPQIRGVRPSSSNLGINFETIFHKVWRSAGHGHVS